MPSEPSNPWQKYDDLAATVISLYRSSLGGSTDEKQTIEKCSTIIGGFVSEQIDLKIRDVELRASKHGADQARREVCHYLRKIGQPAVALAILDRCKWLEGTM